MRIFHWLLFCGGLIVWASCSKSSGPSTSSGGTRDTAALPNTVEKTDTLTVMAYNVLNYGDGCQGSTQTLDAYLRTILQFVQPDLLSCEKMSPFPLTPGAAGNLADEINDQVLNADFPDSYSYATPTNASGDKPSVLFYNKQKLTYVKTETLLVNISDFDLYKLYYNDRNLSITKDTTFLYVVVNHTQSGSSSTSRDQQVTAEMQALRSKFNNLPNLINMGDFNTRNSVEAGYQSIVSSVDSATMMSDPPFFPDRKVHYPANWDVEPYLFEPYLTTSTRLSANIPNSCGTSGGASSWYDHIFISPWLVNGSNYVQYLSGSYQTMGNDGHRLGVDINSTNPVVNGSVPAAVADALFQFSNKYPVSIRLVVTANRNANSPADPVERN